MPQELDPIAPRTPRAARPPGPDALAAQVSMQAARLHERMAQAPRPGANIRNPFTFSTTPAARPVPETIRAAVAADEPAPPAAPPQPALTLMGVAEEATAAGAKRTAVIGLRQAQADPAAGDADAIVMVVEGDLVGDRYRVTKIGADAVELEDLVTKGYRRLALR